MIYAIGNKATPFSINNKNYNKINKIKSANNIKIINFDEKSEF